MKKHFALLGVAASIALGGCSSQADTRSYDSGPLENVDSAYTLPQFQEPEDEDTVAVIHTSMGQIQVVLYPDIAPMTVDNFVTLAENGYYEGVIFHRVMNDFMIQTGDPTGTGFGGESKWGGGFRDEFSPIYHHFRGALSMAKAEDDQNGSQFFIVQGGEVEEEVIEYFQEIAEAYQGQEMYNRTTGANDLVDDILSEETIRAYENVGGSPHLDYGIAVNQHSVFGQVIRGMDVVDQIAAIEVSEEYKPLEDVTIETIEIVQYKDVK